MIGSRRAWLCCFTVTVSACGGSVARVADPIPGLAATQQRTISRHDFRDDWPFEPGTGTLGCIAGAVVFRIRGVSYALNDAARARGYVSVDPIVVSQSRQPSNPLGRIRQDERMRIFRASTDCPTGAAAAACRRRLAASGGLSADDLSQIEAEGRERYWPPLSAPRRSTGPVVQAGLALCPR